MQPEDFRIQFCDSRETFEKFELYHQLLLKWQKAINLVGAKTLPQAWERHFADLAQLVEYIPESTKIITDIGSGAGFPGLVLAIMRPDITVHLVESDDKKAQFLRNVSRESQILNTMIHVKRIEDTTDLTPDLVTARALADVKRLFDYCLPWSESIPRLSYLFLKGRGVAEEIKEAQQHYKFSCESFPSLTARDSTILKISTLIKR